jgi:hypothetical protein
LSGIGGAFELENRMEYRGSIYAVECRSCL